ncbi:hypothetical protein BaRGS_00019522 [Batillaria attramentaria]|uniref:Uncharacterized protein n=1 Tax=Batillaria attramentaria TaxID=370345 RepID=A0ABD0KPT3_9CAEN
MVTLFSCSHQQTRAGQATTASTVLLVRKNLFLTVSETSACKSVQEPVQISVNGKVSERHPRFPNPSRPRVMSLSAAASTVVIPTILLSIVLPVQASSVLNECRQQCRGEDQLKAACGEEHHCAAMFPDIDAYLICMEPCRRLGSNCFQRCAFRTDEITSHCLRQCGMDSVHKETYIISRLIVKQ